MKQYRINKEQLQELLDKNINTDLLEFLLQTPINEAVFSQNKLTLNELVQAIYANEGMQNDIIFTVNHIHYNIEGQATPITVDHEGVNLSRPLEQLGQLIAFKYKDVNQLPDSIIIESDLSAHELEKILKSKPLEIEQYDWIKNQLKNSTIDIKDNTEITINSEKDLTQYFMRCKTSDDIKITIENLGQKILENTSLQKVLINNQLKNIDFNFFVEFNGHKHYIFQNDEFAQRLAHISASIPNVTQHFLELFGSDNTQNVSNDGNQKKYWIDEVKKYITKYKFKNTDNTIKYMETIMKDKGGKNDLEPEAKIRYLCKFFDLIPTQIILEPRVLDYIENTIKNHKRDPNLSNFFNSHNSNIIKEDIKVFIHKYPHIFFQFKPDQYMAEEIASLEIHDLKTILDQLPTGFVLNHKKNFFKIMRPVIQKDEKEVLKCFIEKFPKYITSFTYGGLYEKSDEFRKFDELVKTKEIFDFSVKKECWEIASKGNFEYIKSLTSINKIALYHVLMHSPSLWESSDPIVETWVKKTEIFASIVDQSKTNIDKIDFSDIFTDTLKKNRAVCLALAKTNKALFSKVMDAYQTDVEVMKNYIDDLTVNNYESSSSTISPRMWVNHDFILKALESDLKYISYVDARILNQSAFVLKALKAIDEDKISDSIVNLLPEKIPRMLKEKNVKVGQYHNFFNSIFSYAKLEKTIVQDNDNKKKLKI